MLSNGFSLIESLRKFCFLTERRQEYVAFYEEPFNRITNLLWLRSVDVETCKSVKLDVSLRSREEHLVFHVA